MSIEVLLAGTTLNDLEQLLTLSSKYLKNGLFLNYSDYGMLIGSQVRCVK